MDERIYRQTSETWHVAEILKVAYRKVAFVQNADSGFRKAGLWSLTIYVFQDSDFATATVTKVITEAAQEHNPTPLLTPAVAAPALTAVAMEAVPELCPPKKETIGKQSEDGWR